MKTFHTPFGRLSDLRKSSDAPLILLKPGSGVFSDVKCIQFSSRKALEAFNRKAGLKPLVFTDVPIGCAVDAHESDHKARAERAQQFNIVPLEEAQK